MVTRRLLLIAGCAALLANATAAEAEPVRLKPTADWQLREYDDKCRMIREFGAGEDALTLWIDKGGPGPGVNLTLIGRAVRSPYGPFVRVGFAPGEMVERNFITANSSKGRPVLGLFGVQPISLLPEAPGDAPPPISSDEESVDLTSAAAPAGEAPPAVLKQRYGAITALELAGAVIDPITLELDGMLLMSEQLLACTAALRERLARDYSKAGGLGRSVAALEPEIWAAKIQENYPSHLVIAGQEGSVGVRLTINKEGKPTFCEVTSYTGPASFNDSACLQLLRHAKFTPATDGAGNPVASFYSTRITYRLNK